MLLIDTGPLLDLFKGTSEVAQATIADAEESGQTIAISVVTMSELLYILARFGGLEFAQKCLRTVLVRRHF